MTHKRTLEEIERMAVSQRLAELMSINLTVKHGTVEEMANNFYNDKMFSTNDLKKFVARIEARN